MWTITTLLAPCRLGFFITSRTRPSGSSCTASWANGGRSMYFTIRAKRFRSRPSTEGLADVQPKQLALFVGKGNEPLVAVGSPFMLVKRRAGLISGTEATGAGLRSMRSGFGSTLGPGSPLPF